VGGVTGGGWAGISTGAFRWSGPLPTPTRTTTTTATTAAPTPTPTPGGGAATARRMAITGPIRAGEAGRRAERALAHPCVSHPRKKERARHRALSRPVEPTEPAAR